MLNEGHRGAPELCDLIFDGLVKVRQCQAQEPAVVVMTEPQRDSIYDHYTDTGAVPFEWAYGDMKIYGLPVLVVAGDWYLEPHPFRLDIRNCDG